MRALLRQSWGWFSVSRTENNGARTARGMTGVAWRTQTKAVMARDIGLGHFLPEHTRQSGRHYLVYRNCFVIQNSGATAANSERR